MDLGCPATSSVWPLPPGRRYDSDSPSSSDDDDDNNDNDNVLGDYAGPEADDWDEGSFGDDEQVAVASDLYSWKIDHARGDHKLQGA